MLLVCVQCVQNPKTATFHFKFKYEFNSKATFKSENMITINSSILLLNKGHVCLSSLLGLNSITSDSIELKCCTKVVNMHGLWKGLFKNPFVLHPTGVQCSNVIILGMGVFIGYHGNITVTLGEESIFIQ